MQFNKLIPELSVSDFEKSLGFYIKIIGFKLEYRRDESKFAFLSFGEAQIMVEQVNEKWKTAELKKPFGRGINLQIEVSDLDKIIKSLKDNNWPIRFGPENNCYRKEETEIECREIVVEDPDGYLLRFSQETGAKPTIKE